MARASSLAWILGALVAFGCPASGPSATPDNAADAEAALAGSNLPELIESPLTGDPLAATIHRLSNGMTVYISTVRDVPRVRALVAVRAGGRHAPAHSTGLAHYLEHMVLFKGSDELGTVDHEAETPHLEAIRELYRELSEAQSAEAREAIFAKIDEHTQAVARTSIPNEIPKLYDRLGFSGTNAFTYPDHTHYITELPTNRLRQWAQLESERLVDPVFRLFYPELEAVYEEYNRALDNAPRRLLEQARAAAFPEHPYGTITVLGKAEHLKTPAFDEMAAFYDRWYVPNNMAIALAGDVDASVLPLLEETFGRLEPAPLQEPEPGKLDGPEGRVEVTVEAPGTQSVRLVWRTVASGHADIPALEVLDRLLDDDLVGRLNALVLTGRVPWARSYNDFMHEAGMTTLEAGVRDDSTHDEVEAMLRQAAAALANGETTQAQLDAAKLQIRLDEIRRYQEAGPRAWRMVQAFVQGEDWTNVAGHAKAIEAVTLEDVQRVAKVYLGENFVAGRIVRGSANPQQLPKPKITPLEFSTQPRSALAATIEDANVQPIEPVFLELGRDAVVTETDYGRLFTAKNDDNDLFDLYVAWDRGAREEQLLCHAWSVLERSGTAEQSAQEFQVALYQLGATVRVGCGMDSAWVYVGGIDEHFEATTSLVERWLLTPHLTDPVREATVAAMLTNRRAATDHDVFITSALRNAVYFGEQSPMLLEPSNAQLRKAPAKKLAKLLTDNLAYEHVVLYYGPREASAIPAFGTGSKKPRPRHLRRYEPLATTEVHVVHRESAQATINIVFPNEPIERDQLALTSSLATYLRRQSFDELRGARALAYVVTAGVDIGDDRDQASLWGRIQAQPDKVVDAVPAFIELLRADSVERARLEGAVSEVAESVRTDRSLRGDALLEIEDWDDFGIDRDRNAVTWDGLPEVDTAAATKLLRSMSKGPAFVTIVGDTSRIALDDLAKIGKVEMHEIDELFSFGAF